MNLFEQKTLEAVSDKSKRFPIVDGPFGTQLHSEEYQAEGIPVIRVTNLSFDGRFLNEDMVYISEKKAQKLSRSELSENDLIIAKTGATIGKAALFPLKKGLIASSCLKTSLDKAQVDPRFVLYLIVSAEGQRKILDSAGGSTRTTINITPFSKISFSFPPRDFQTKIAKVLVVVDQAIEHTELLIAKYQRIKTGLMQDLLTRGIDEHGCLRDPATHKFKESPIGLIPDEWQIKQLQQIAEVDRGQFKHRPRNDPAFYCGEHPFIQTGDITNNLGRHLYTFSQTLSDRGVTVSRLFPAETIAVTIAANIADTAILGIPMYFPDSVVGVVVSKGYSTRFVELCIRARKRTLESLAPQSAQKNINLEHLRPLLIPVPCPEEQNIISQVYESTLRSLELEEAELTKLQKVKAGLMQDLLTGKVSVEPLLEPQPAN